MKKIIPVILCLMMVFSVISFAAVTPADIPVNETTQKITVEYTEGAAGAYYALVVVEGEYTAEQTPVITEDSIQYIDQKTADTNGDVKFTDFLLKEDGTTCTVYLGGSNMSSALLLGWVNAEEETFVVSGTVTSASTDEATVTITSTSDATKIYTDTTDTAGKYEVSGVPAGTYKFEVTKAKHLSYTKNEFVVEGETKKDVTIKGGELVVDGKIEYQDLGTLLSVYNTTNESCNLIGDAKIDYQDLGVLLTNYNETATVE